MNDIYLSIYNNLIKLTRNKNLYSIKKQDTFYDRMIILFLHLSFLLKDHKNKETKENLQSFFDFCIRQIELSIREQPERYLWIHRRFKHRPKDDLEIYDQSLMRKKR